VDAKNESKKFWDLINSLRNSGVFAERLRAEIEQLSCMELEAFNTELKLKIKKIDEQIDLEKLGMGDDVSLAYCSWIISMGEEFFAWVVESDRFRVESFVSLLHESDAFDTIFPEGELMHNAPHVLFHKRKNL
jgi:hypothetical protein